jgi:PII-like signaling protein
MVGKPEEGFLLRVFIGESDKFDNKPLYQVIVEKAREENLKGATVLRGVMGFGAASKIHTSQILALSEDLPLVVEIVDTKENLGKMLPFLNNCMKGGMVTIEKATVIMYSDGIN